MGIQVGKVNNVTFEVVAKGDVPLGKNVVEQFQTYTTGCSSIQTFVSGLAAVTVVIKTYSGSGAVTIHKNKQVIVDRNISNKTDGVQEMAESVLFELVNWSQGDFATTHQTQVKNGAISPQEAGVAIAKHEAYSVHTHGQFMQALKIKEIPLSSYGEKQRTETTGKTLDEVVRITMTTAHDSSAQGTMMSMATPEMYWYQTVSGIASTVLCLQAINSPPKWLETCIEKLWTYQDSSGEDAAAIFVKILNLAKLAGCTLKGGFEFTSAMKIVAKETGGTSSRFQMSAKTIPSEKGMPEGLADWMKSVHLLA